MAVEWKAIYAIDVKDIDDQHRYLFELGNQVYQLALEGNNVDHQIQRIIEQLEQYTLEHLEYEEALMATLNYPDRAKHVQEHQRFRIQLKTIKQEMQEQSGIEAKMQLILFITDWIAKHIMLADQELGHFIHSQGGSLPSDA